MHYAYYGTVVKSSACMSAQAQAQARVCVCVCEYLSRIQPHYSSAHDFLADNKPLMASITYRKTGASSVERDVSKRLIYGHRRASIKVERIHSVRTSF